MILLYLAHHSKHRFIMVTLNFILLLNLTYMVSTQTRKSFKNSSPHKFVCPEGKIFLYSACYSRCPDNRLPDSELEKLYRNCSNVESCNFKTELNNNSTITYVCEGTNLYFLPDVTEDGLTKKSDRILLYYDGRDYKNTHRGLWCVIKPETQMNLYENWIIIQDTSRIVLEIVVLGQRTKYLAGTSIYRRNRKLNGSVTLKLLPDPNQHDQLSIGFTTNDGTLDTNCSTFDISEKPGEHNTIIIIVVCVAIIVIIIGVSCIIYRKQKTFMARREERCVQLTKTISETKDQFDLPKENNKQRELNNHNYATSENASKSRNTFQTECSDDVSDSMVPRDGKKIINMKQLESCIKSSGYSEPIDSLRPIKISLKAGDYAEPCNENECFTSKCLQTKLMLENYGKFDNANNPKSGGNTYSQVDSNQKEDNYDHFESVKGINSKLPLPDGNYSHIPVKGLGEDDYNTTSHILSEETTPNPNYDHIGQISPNN